MQSQPKRDLQPFRIAGATTRRDVRNNVIQWRAQASAERKLPAAPGEDGTPELIPASRQNVWLEVLVIIVFLVVAGRMAGAI